MNCLALDGDYEARCEKLEVSKLYPPRAFQDLSS